METIKCLGTETVDMAMANSSQVPKIFSTSCTVYIFIFKKGKKGKRKKKKKKKKRKKRKKEEAEVEEVDGE